MFIFTFALYLFISYILFCIFSQDLLYIPAGFLMVETTLADDCISGSAKMMTTSEASVNKVRGFAQALTGMQRGSPILDKLIQEHDAQAAKAADEAAAASAADEAAAANAAQAIGANDAQAAREADEAAAAKAAEEAAAAKEAAGEANDPLQPAAAPSEG